MLNLNAIPDGTGPLSVDRVTPTTLEPAGPDTSAQVEALRDSAQSFEAAFIAQMLNFSGLTEALTSGEGQMASAFSSFFLEALAQDIAEDGGFGMADTLYDSLQSRLDDGATPGLSL